MLEKETSNIEYNQGAGDVKGPFAATMLPKKKLKLMLVEQQISVAGNLRSDLVSLSQTHWHVCDFQILFLVLSLFQKNCTMSNSIYSYFNIVSTKKGDSSSRVESR